MTGIVPSARRNSHSNALSAISALCDVRVCDDFRYNRMFHFMRQNKITFFLLHNHMPSMPKHLETFEHVYIGATRRFKRKQKEK